MASKTENSTLNIISPKIEANVVENSAQSIGVEES
jgi:hypothetical protein